MANVAVTSDAWTEISITSGTVQNISATADIELSAEQTDNSGVVLKPSEIYQWDNKTIYARAVTEDTGALRVVNFKKAAGGGGGYVLPVASASTLGGVKIGSNVNVDSDGVISVAAPYSLPTAAADTLGGVKIGDNITIDANGAISATSAYTLPPATTSTLGGVIVGDNISVDANGEISTHAPYSLPAATANDLGGVKIGSNVNVDANGVISVSAPYSLPTATANDLGGVKIGSNITIDANGAISAPAAYTLPTASNSTLGGIKIGQNLFIDANGVLSAATPSTDPVGRVVYDVILRTGYIKANGATVADASTSVPNLLQFVQDNSATLLAADAAAYAANVGLYLYDSGTDELTLPDYTDRYMAGANSISALDAKIATHAHVYQSYGATGGSNVESVKSVIGEPNTWPPGATNVTLDSEFPSNWNCGANSASGSTIVASGISTLLKTGHTIYDDSGTTRPKTITMIPQIKY